MKFTWELVKPSRALELVRYLQREIEAQKVDIKGVVTKPTNMLFEAATSGNFEFVAELVRFYPELIHVLDEKGRSISHTAILHRRTSIFKLIYEIGLDKDLLAAYEDSEKNTLLHLAAMYPNPPPVSDLPGAALEMQPEILIFKEVEMMMTPSLRETKNLEGRTPQQLFSIEHSNLLKRGERWMKDAANSCLVAATLIATVVFSAAFTRPTPPSDNHVLNVRMGTWFHVYAFSDAVALSASSVSVLVFLCILTSVQEMKFTWELVKPSRALELVRCLQREIEAQKVEMKGMITKPTNMLFEAATSGNFEFVAELVRFYPELVHMLDEKGRSIFHTAILHRRTSVFKLIYEIGLDKDLLAGHEDKEKNTLLHLAAMYPNPPPDSDLPGAALEMQREILIFKEVEMMMTPSLRETKNLEGRTPQQLFSIEHSNLLKRGERWIKDAANSCLVAATLIATVVFSAAFTRPTPPRLTPPSDNHVLNVLLMGTWFHVYAFSDAVALSASSVSVLVFLCILTSGFKEKDFHRSLLIKLMFGLCSLFLSLLSMMVTFSSSFFIAYGGISSIYIPLGTFIFVAVPVTLFVFLQYPLLRHLYLLNVKNIFP
ncbi:hypothetical protein Dsin_029626 [Dipteronia sinensis]|uniref:PGG domain-containing protein n=1 Tax=Dipteronia sinensis TaxID=43782 RepID=A0AAD9ZSW5_9ROSI|nr:hypothetical protein Dsin_029626 [Dipteronia sinensis]